MKVAIVGSRDFDWNIGFNPNPEVNRHTQGMKQMIRSLVEKMDCEDYVVSGGAAGADNHGEHYAQFYNVGRIIHAAHWDKHGKAAGPIRNALIVRDADVLFAFYTDIQTSRGTLNCVLQAKKKGIKRYEYDSRENVWYINGTPTPECFSLDYKEALSQVNQSTAQRDEGVIRKDGIDLRIPLQPRPK